MVGFVRKFYVLILLALTVVVPYAMMGESGGAIREKIQGFLASKPSGPGQIEGIDDPEVSRLLAMQQQVGADSQAQEVALNMTPTVTLDAILRFDVTPQWVMQQWPHVSTTRVGGSLDGLRVPVITGTNSHDVVGSLTYYFDAQQQVQRISIDGVTGSERQIVALATQRFELKPESRAGVGVYVSRWNGKPVSALWVRRMAVVHTRDGTQQYEFSMEVNRPSNYHGLSTRLQQRIQNAHASIDSANLVR